MTDISGWNFRIAPRYGCRANFSATVSRYVSPKIRDTISSNSLPQNDFYRITPRYGSPLRRGGLTPPSWPFVSVPFLRAEIDTVEGVRP
jgi:hypothetical protein